MALDAKQLADLLKLRAIGWSQKDIADAMSEETRTINTYLRVKTIIFMQLITTMDP